MDKAKYLQKQSLYIVLGAISSIRKPKEHYALLLRILSVSLCKEILIGIAFCSIKEKMIAPSLFLYAMVMANTISHSVNVVDHISSISYINT